MDYREGLTVVINDGITDPQYGTIVRTNKKTYRVRVEDSEVTVPKEWVSYYDMTPPIIEYPAMPYGVVFKLADNSTEFANLGVLTLPEEQVCAMVHKIMNNPNAEFISIGRFAIRKSLVQHYRVYIRKS